MDAHKTTEVTENLATIPRIRRRSAEWIAAQPSRVLNLGLAASWLGFLFTIGFFSAPAAEPTAPLGFVDTFALTMFMVTLVGIITVIALAFGNSRATAPVSAIAGLAIIVVGATCGFVGHPAAAWGPDAALAAGIVGASLVVMSRRDATVDTGA